MDIPMLDTLDMGTAKGLARKNEAEANETISDGPLSDPAFPSVRFSFLTDSNTPHV